MTQSKVPVEKLRQVAFFKDFSEEAITNIAAITTERTFPARSVVFSEGDFGDALYIVKSGLVSIQKKDRHGFFVVIATYSDGEVIGDMALIDEQPRSASLVTMEETTFYIIQGSHFQLFLFGQWDVTRSTLLLLTKRIRMANEKLICNALDDHPDMVILTDQKFQITNINKQAQLKLGISADLRGDPGIIANLRILLDKVQKKAPKFVPMTWILLKPERLYFGVHVSPLESDKGSVFGYLLEFRDVTEDRNRSRRSLEIISVIIHRLPGLVEKICNPPKGNPLPEDQFSARETTKKTLLQQVDKLVAFTDLEAGPLRIDRDLVNPEEILQRIVANLRQSAELRKLEIEFHLGFGEGQIIADPDWLAKLFSLLIENAINYSSSGAPVKISTFPSATGGFCFRIQNPIPITLREEVCLRFFDLGKQLDEFENQRVSEFGLDLPLAKYIVEAHHGVVRIEPNLPQLFSLEFEIP